MNRYIAVLLVIVGLTHAGWSQETPEPSSSNETTTSEASASPAAEEQTNEESAEAIDGEDAFSPTEKIKIDSAVSFPVDI